MEGNLNSHDMVRLQRIKENGLCIECGLCDANNKVECYFDEKFANDKVSHAKRVHDAISEPTNNNIKEVTNASDVFVVSISNEGRRLKSSSGGALTHIAEALHERNLVDFSIMVGISSQGFPEYRVTDSIDVNLDTKSKYYPVNIGSVIQNLESNKTYLLIALPCHVAMIRNLQAKGELKNIKYVFSLFCGHLKTRDYSDYLTKKLSVGKQNNQYLDFRWKVKGRNASKYGTAIVTKEKNEAVYMMNEKIPGVNWGIGFFKYNGCDFCNDVTGYYADLSVGDAWMTPYVANYLGSSIVVSRSLELTEILKHEISANRLIGSAVNSISIFESQEGGFRNKSSGFLMRMAKNKFYNQTSNIKYKEYYRLRYVIRNKLSRIDKIYKLTRSAFLFDLAAKITVKIYGLICRMDNK